MSAFEHRVVDAMTQHPHTCAVGTTVQQAAQIMRDQGLGDVLVVDGDGSLVGVLTDRDIAVRAVADHTDAGSVAVGEVCSRDPVTITPDRPSEEAVELMRTHAVRRLPVVDRGRLLGIVSLGDLAEARDPGSALADISAARPNT